MESGPRPKAPPRDSPRFDEGLCPSITPFIRATLLDLASSREAANIQMLRRLAGTFARTHGLEALRNKAP